MVDLLVGGKPGPDQSERLQAAWLALNGVPVSDDVQDLRERGVAITEAFRPLLCRNATEHWHGYISSVPPLMRRGVLIKSHGLNRISTAALVSASKLRATAGMISCRPGRLIPLHCSPFLSGTDPSLPGKCNRQSNCCATSFVLGACADRRAGSAPRLKAVS
jgi:hypothetical protein